MNKTFEQICAGLDFHDAENYNFDEQYEGFLLFRASETHSPSLTQMRYGQASIHATAFKSTAIGMYGDTLYKSPIARHYLSDGSMADGQVFFVHVFRATEDQQFYPEFGAQHGYKSQRLDEIQGTLDTRRHHDTLILSIEQYVSTHLIIERSVPQKNLGWKNLGIKRAPKKVMLLSDLLPLETMLDLSHAQVFRTEPLKKDGEKYEAYRAQQLLRQKGFYSLTP